jgi:hypothetical protein
MLFMPVRHSAPSDCMNLKAMLRTGTDASL